MKPRTVIMLISCLVLAGSMIILAMVLSGRGPNTGVVAGTTQAGRVNVKLTVMNGCGRSGLASAAVKEIRRRGYDVVNGMGGNADSFDYDTSVIVDRRGMGEKARMLARSFGIKLVVDQRSHDPYMVEDMVVILGRDWDTLALFSKEGNE